MDYGKIIRDALHIAWTKKYLWAFGVFASLGGFSPRAFKGDGDAANSPLGPVLSWMLAHPVLSALAILCGALVLLILAVLQIISYGGLIRAVGDIDRGLPSSFDSTIEHGFSLFGRMLGMMLLFAAVIAAYLLLALLPLVLMMAAGPAAKVLAVIWLVLLLVPTIGLFVAMGLVWMFAARICVLEDKGVLESIGAGWRLVKGRPSEAVVLGAIGLGLGLGYALAFLLAR